MCVSSSLFGISWPASTSLKDVPHEYLVTTLHDVTCICMSSDNITRTCTVDNLDRPPHLCSRNSFYNDGNLFDINDCAQNLLTLSLSALWQGSFMDRQDRVIATQYWQNRFNKRCTESCAFKMGIYILNLLWIITIVVPGRVSEETNWTHAFLSLSYATCMFHQLSLIWSYFERKWKFWKVFYYIKS